MKALVQLSIAGQKTLRLLALNDRYQLEMRVTGTIPAHEEWQSILTDGNECSFPKTKEGLQKALRAFHDFAEDLFNFFDQSFCLKHPFVAYRK